MAAEPTQDCWEWNGPRDRHRYGMRTINYQRHFTHRLAYAWANGQIPNGMCVLHRCDNPPCCNPEHLFLGTQQDNLADMRSKGRSRSSKGQQFSQGRTHCPQGHEYKPGSFYLHANGRYKRCKACISEQGRRAHMLKKGNV